MSEVSSCSAELRVDFRHLLTTLYKVWPEDDNKVVVATEMLRNSVFLSTSSSPLCLVQSLFEGLNCVFTQI